MFQCYEEFHLQSSSQLCAAQSTLQSKPLKHDKYSGNFQHLLRFIVLPTISQLPQRLILFSRHIHPLLQSFPRFSSFDLVGIWHHDICTAIENSFGSSVLFLAWEAVRDEKLFRFDVGEQPPLPRTLVADSAAISGCLGPALRGVRRGFIVFVSNATYDEDDDRASSVVVT